MGDSNGSMRDSEEPRSKKHDLGLGPDKPMETPGRPGHIECAPSHTTQHAQVVAQVPVLESHSFNQEPSVSCRTMTKDHSGETDVSRTCQQFTPQNLSVFFSIWLLHVRSSFP